MESKIVERLKALNTDPERLLAKAESGGIELEKLIDWYERYEENRARHNKHTHSDHLISSTSEGAYEYIQYLEGTLATLLGTGDWRAAYRGWMSDLNRKTIWEYRQASVDNMKIDHKIIWCADHERLREKYNKTAKTSDKLGGHPSAVYDKLERLTCILKQVFDSDDWEIEYRAWLLEKRKMEVNNGGTER